MTYRHLSIKATKWLDRPERLDRILRIYSLLFKWVLEISSTQKSSIGQRKEKCFQILKIIIGQIERTDERILCRVMLSTHIVVLKHLVQCKAPVMFIGTGHHNVTQRRSEKFAVVRAQMTNVCTAAIDVERKEAGRVILIVCKVESGVA